MQIRRDTLPVLPELEALKPARVAAAAAAPRANSRAAAAEESPRASALWDVLTPDEQAFFREQNALGPLTYGRQTSREGPAAPTGQRLDAKA